MGIAQLPPPPAPPSSRRAAKVITGGTYSLLFLLGFVGGVLGSFQYSRAVVGPVPLAALGCCIAIFLSCALAGWAMQGVPAALVVAIGWFLASFGLAMPVAGGSVIIANTTSGEWYLYGGSVCALVGVGTAFVASIRLPSGSRRIGGGGFRA